MTDDTEGSDKKEELSKAYVTALASPRAKAEDLVKLKAELWAKRQDLVGSEKEAWQAH